MIDRWILSRFCFSSGRSGDGTGEFPGHEGLPGRRGLSERGSVELVRSPVQGPVLGQWGIPGFPGSLQDPLGGPGGLCGYGPDLALRLRLDPPGPHLRERSSGLLSGADASLVDEELEKGMAAVRALVSLGRAAREEVQIRVRQPLGKMFAVTPGGLVLDGDLLALLKDELNVKEVDFLESAEGLVGLMAKPNFRSLGPRFQKKSEEAATVIRALRPRRYLLSGTGRRWRSR